MLAVDLQVRLTGLVKFRLQMMCPPEEGKEYTICEKISLNLASQLRTLITTHSRTRL